MFQSNLRRMSSEATRFGFSGIFNWEIRAMSVEQIARWGCVALLAAAWNSAAFAANGLPSRATLNEMGLGGLQIMSDAEGLAVRGQGAIAYGKSWAVVSAPGASAGSTNGYLSEG